jgi:cytochrome c
MKSRSLTLVVLTGAVAAMFVASTVRLLSAQNNPGKQIFEKRCTGCHALDNEKTGPHLRGVYGRSAAGVSSFLYSEALRKSGITWDNVTLDKWLTDPDTFIPNSDMAFRVANAEERAAIIGYLKEVSGK